MTERRTIATNEDPVCGMTVDVDEAMATGRTTTFDGVAYVFCGKGCLLEFRDDPERHLSADYQPSM
jgi:YHS domain-containing protein